MFIGTLAGGLLAAPLVGEAQHVREPVFRRRRRVMREAADRMGATTIVATVSDPIGESEVPACVRGDGQGPGAGARGQRSRRGVCQSIGDRRTGRASQVTSDLCLPRVRRGRRSGLMAYGIDNADLRRQWPATSTEFSRAPSRRSFPFSKPRSVSWSSTSSPPKRSA